MGEHLLVEIGRQMFRAGMNRTEPYPFLHDEAKDAFLNDLENYPHAFVLAGIMDRQMKSSRCWDIPCKIKDILGTFEIDGLAAVSLDRYRIIFQENRLHRHNSVMSVNFYDAVQRIKNVYWGDVSLIWRDSPPSARVVYEFLQFEGIGIKIATMLANILVRDFHIPLSDYGSIDISTDTHAMRVMKRVGLISKNASREAAVYKARELNPDYPGVMDYVCWEIGRNYCKNKKPDCTNCPITQVCDKKIEVDV